MIIRDKIDLTYLQFSHIRNSSGTAGSFLKSGEIINGKKIYYKLSNYINDKGIVGHECINEIIVNRLLEILGAEHLSYDLVHADVMIEGNTYTTWLNKSEDFKKANEIKSPLDDFYSINRTANENRYDFCKRMGWEKYIDTMIAVDYIIMNRDRHGANIEVLKDKNNMKRLAPLYDHGLSLLFSCGDENEIRNYDITIEKKCNNFIGSNSNKNNVDKYLSGKEYVFKNKLSLKDKEYIFKDIDNLLSKEHKDKIWEMIYTRWCYYESISN